MDFDNTNLSIEQMQKCLRLCDILGLEDFTVGVAILEQYQWNLEKAMDEISFGNQIPKQPAPPVQPPAYSFDDEQNEQEYNEYEYNYSQLQQKKQMFQEQYVSFPLQKTTSLDNPNARNRLLKYTKQWKELSYHRGLYTQNLLNNSEKLYSQMIEKLPKEKQKLYLNRRRIQLNRKFIGYLYEHYKPKINFTFGTFLLNLARSYLEDKYLLVYVHKYSQECNKAVQMILQHKEIAKLVHQNCVSYGMFDNSDDYEIVQKYLMLKDVPSFMLFQLNVKTQSQRFISNYNVVQKQGKNFIQWLASEIGVVIKKKDQQKVVNKTQVEKKPQKKEKQEKRQSVKLHQIVNEQNSEYERMEEAFKLKRLKSKLEKEKIINLRMQIQKMKKQKFNTEIQFESDKCIKFKLRLPTSGKSLCRVFLRSDSVEKLFDYIHCFGRQEFQNQFGQFDLTQTFPFISLKQHIKKKIGEVFPQSDQENLIVKQQ